MLASLTATPASAFDGQPPRVQGQTCEALAGHHPLWRASYWARVKGDFDEWQTFLVSPCFTSKADCEAWFYWAQSDWTNQIASRRCYPVG